MTKKGPSVDDVWHAGEDYIYPTKLIRGLPGRTTGRKCDGYANVQSAGRAEDTEPFTTKAEHEH